jgi:hypothetical protein
MGSGLFLLGYAGGIGDEKLILLGAGFAALSVPLFFAIRPYDGPKDPHAPPLWRQVVDIALPATVLATGIVLFSGGLGGGDKNALYVGAGLAAVSVPVFYFLNREADHRRVAIGIGLQPEKKYYSMSLAYRF